MKKEKRKPETIQERAIRRKVVVPNSGTRARNVPAKDQYEGHGAQPEELQAWQRQEVGPIEQGVQYQTLTWTQSIEEGD